MPYYPRKICKYIQEYLILPGCFEFVLQVIIQNKSTSTQKGKILTEHLILSVCPDFELSRTPQFPRQKHTSEHLFYRTAANGCFQISVVFLEREKQKNFFTTPEAVVMRCSVNKVVLKNFTKFAGKHLCQSLSFNKVPGLRLWHKCFPVNFVKIS